MRIPFLFIMMFLLCGTMSSQNVVIGTKFRTENSTCATENTDKTILFEMNQNGTFRLLKKFIIKNCENYNTYPKFFGKFRVTVQAEKYESQSLDFEINATTKDSLILKEIVLIKSNPKSLDEVTITGIKRSSIKIDADKTTVTIKNNDMLSSGTVYDAVAKLPGVLLNTTGMLTLNGKVTAVWLDGQPTNLSGQDLINFLNNLPASVVEKVEIISNPGSSYDANTAGGIINIITVSKSMKGLSGSANTNFIKNKYEKYGASINLTGRIKKVGWQLTTGGSSNNGEERKTSEAVFTDTSTPAVLNQNNFTQKHNSPFFIRTGIDYYLTKKITFGAKYNVNINRNTPTTSSSISSYAPLFISYDNYNRSLEKSNQNELTVYYKQKLDSIGKEINIIGNWSVFDKDLNNSLTQNNLVLASSGYGITKNDLKIDNKYSKIDIILPFEKFTINTGVKLGLNLVYSNGFYNTNSNNPLLFEIPVYSLEKHFNYKENNFAAYTEFKKKINKFNFNAGLRFQSFTIQSKVEGNPNDFNRNYANLFPSLSMLYEINSTFDLTFSYSRKIDQPGYTQLDPNINGYYDKFSNPIGNPLLTANFFNNFETKLSFFKFGFIGFNYSYANSQNILVFENNGNLQTTSTVRTFDGVKNYTFNMALPIPFKLFTEGTKFFNSAINQDKISYLYLYMGMNYYKLDNVNDYVLDYKPFFNLNAYSQIVLPKDFKLYLNYLLATKGTYQIYQINTPIQKVDISLSRQFLNKKLKATFIASDIFNSFKQNVIINAPYLTTNYTSKIDSQSFAINLSYNFGKFSALHKAAKVDAENEKNRIEKKTDIVPAGGN